jgi:hypothetical protein
MYGLPEAEPVILAVTKLHPRESPWDLLRAYCAMDSPGCCLWLIGDGPERRALEEYARLHTSVGVVFSGYVPYPELPAAYDAADAFVHPARYEPWGVSVQEALALRLARPRFIDGGCGTRLRDAGKERLQRSGTRDRAPLALLYVGTGLAYTAVTSIVRSRTRSQPSDGHWSQSRS